MLIGHIMVVEINISTKVKGSIILCFMKPNLYANLKYVGAMVIEFHFFNLINERKLMEEEEEEKEEEDGQFVKLILKILYITILDIIFTVIFIFILV